MNRVIERGHVEIDRERKDIFYWWREEGGEIKKFADLLCCTQAKNITYVSLV